MIKIVFFLAIILLLSCQKGSRCIHSMGEITEEIRYVSAFNCLRINSLMDVYWHKDTGYKLVVSTGKNMLPFIKTEINGNQLNITNENKCNWLRRYRRLKVDIYSPSLKNIELHGNGDFYLCDTMYNDTIIVDNWCDISKIILLVHCNTFSYSQNAGTGDTFVYGSAGVCFFWAMGYGYIHASDLKTAYNYVTHKSTGNFYVHASKEVGARMFSTGNLYIYGHPDSVEKEIHSSGKVFLVE